MSFIPGSGLYAIDTTETFDKKIAKMAGLKRSHLLQTIILSRVINQVLGDTLHLFCGAFHWLNNQAGQVEVDPTGVASHVMEFQEIKFHPQKAM